MNETFENKIKTKQPLSQTVESPTPFIAKPKRKISRTIYLLCSYLLVAVVAWQIAVYVQNSPAHQQEKAKKEFNTMVKKVGTLVLLPESEVPQIAIIQAPDIDVLRKSQEFFADAENGDKVLVYSQARKAVLYRESINKVINITSNITNTPDADPVKQPIKEFSATTSSSTNVTQ